MLFLWTDYVAMRRALPGIQAAMSSGARVRPDLRVLVGVGGDGGWELERAEAVMNDLRGLGINVWPRASSLVAYRGHTLDSWSDTKVWSGIADRFAAVCNWARRNHCGGVALDLEPYIGDGGVLYPAQPSVGSVSSAVADALIAMRPLIAVMSRWSRHLCLAPGGLEYGPIGYIITMFRRAYWLDEWTLAGDSSAMQYAGIRSNVARVIDARYVPGLRAGNVTPAVVDQWRQAGYGDLWFLMQSAAVHAWTDDAWRELLYAKRK